MICQKKNKKLHVYCLLLLLCLVVVTPLFYSVNSYASESSLQTVDEYFREHSFYDTVAFVCRKYASFPYYDYVTGTNSGIYYDAFADYLEEKGKSNLLNENVIVTGSGGGRSYDIPQDVRQEMVNFVQENYINQNPLSYTECSISSYNYLDPTPFPSYNMYKAVKDYMANHEGYHVIQYVGTGSSGMTQIRIATISHDNNLGFVGTTSNGIFTQVRIYKDWVSNFDVTECPLFVTNGTITNRSTQNIQFNLFNGTSVTKGYIYTSYPKNELVYVFPTLNAFKNYNTQYSQPYYLPSNSSTVVPYYDGFTQSDLNSAGNFYNNIVINTEGASPNDVKKKTDSVLGSLSGFLGSDEESDNGGGLLGGLGDIITGATGAISPIKEIVLGDIKALIEDTFSWLPPTIITIWIAGITFGVFFGVLKLIRG